MLQDGEVMMSLKTSLWNPDARGYFDFADCGNKYCRQLNCIMSLLGIIIPNPDDIWMMLTHHNP